MASGVNSFGFPEILVACYRGKVNCSYTDGSVDANPDVAGLGVLIAFLATSIITFVAIVVGYITFSVDKRLLAELDIYFIRAVRSLLRIGDGTSISAEARKTRNEVLTRFVLTLSDQQLITGLAILITGYYQRCSLSGYHFVIVANLAWFSSMTHLSTLAVLHYYLLAHPYLKAIRVVGMLCILGMLVHAQLYVQWYTIFSLPIQCTFAMGFPGLSTAAQDGVYTFFNASIWAGIIIYLLLVYGNNLVRLFAPPPATSLVSLAEIGLRRLFGLKPHASYKAPPDNHATSLHPRSASPDPNGAVHRRRGFVARSEELVSSLYAGWTLLKASFMWEIMWMIFGNVFGITQVYISRWGLNPNASLGTTYTVVGNENEMSFGQIVALLLLALPLLAAGEAYSDLKEPDSEPAGSDADETTNLDTPNTGSEGRSVQQIGVAKVSLIVLVVTGCLVFFAVEAALSWLYPSSNAVIVDGALMYIFVGLVTFDIALRCVRIVTDM